MELIEKYSEAIKSALDGIYPDTEGLAEVQRYSLLAGGKRIRPVLALAFCELFGGRAEDAMAYACAIELIHTASLIHDDLPSIDNDDLRRGRPTSHTVFGEAAALLAADGMLMDAFGLLAGNSALSPEANALAVAILSEATGSRGLVGGEYLDVMGEGRRLSLDELRQMEEGKTGALIRAAACLGAVAAGVKLGDGRMEDAVTYAESVGLAFQIVDDILDVIGTAKDLGKNPGSDQREEKCTYLSFYTVEEASALAEELTRRAVDAVAKYKGGEGLAALAEGLCYRRK